MLYVVLCFVRLASWLSADFIPLGLIGLASWNLVSGAFFGAVIIPCAMSAGRVLGTNILEALVAALVASIPFLDASGGHFEKPRWFADLVVARGQDPALLLSWAGGSLILLSVLGLLSIPSSKSEKRERPSGLLFVILLAGGFTFLLSTQLPPVPATPHQPPRPPMSFAGTPPPPRHPNRAPSPPSSSPTSPVALRA